MCFCDFEEFYNFYAALSYVSGGLDANATFHSVLNMTSRYEYVIILLDHAGKGSLMYQVVQITKLYQLQFLQVTRIYMLILGTRADAKINANISHSNSMTKLLLLLIVLVFDKVKFLFFRTLFDNKVIKFAILNNFFKKAHLP